MDLRNRSIALRERWCHHYTAYYSLDGDTVDGASTRGPTGSLLVDTMQRKTERDTQITYSAVERKTWMGRKYKERDRERERERERER